LKGLTKRQLEILSYIQEFIQTHRYSPSYREIMEHFGFTSLGTIHRHVGVLKRKGALINEKQSSRSLSLAEVPIAKEIKSTYSLPFIGHIRFGTPIETFPQTQTVVVPDYFVHVPERTYVFRAVGESFQDELIGDGDLLIVEARQEACAGETVVVLINQHEIYIKRYFPEGLYVRLTSLHPNHEQPIILRHEDIAIQGILVGMIRLYG
jgi:repressor LexA